MRTKSKARPTQSPSLPAPDLARKPMARAVRVALFEREVRERLSASAIEILLGRAQILAEGQRAASATAEGAFFGSIMITVDLRALLGDVREPLDEKTAARVCDLMSSDARVIRRVRQVAEREAERLAGAKVRAHSADVRMRAEGPLVLIDVDVEGPPATP